MTTVTALEELRSELEKHNTEHSQAWKDFGPADRVMHRLISILIEERKASNVET